jgi:squalene-hopene/tetraprenyl-beta-curcumene cyclase
MLVAAVLACANLRAADDGEAVRLKAVEKGIDYLKSSQADDGSWTTTKTVGITGIVVNALLDSGVSKNDPAVQKALKHLEGFVQDDGGIYIPKSTHRNYETCIALMAFSAADKKEYATLIKNADKFLRELQWDEGENKEPSDTYYGGAGYGGSSRPDLSNTQFLLEALKTAGATKEDPAFKKALIFVSRTQNLESEYNTTEFAAKVNDGGFYYSPAAGGSSQAGKNPDGGLRSYGSMTYAGLKSMIYAGLKPDDPRVTAAMTWISKFYTLEENPGLGQQGLYYYYQTFGKTLSVLGNPTFTDAQGKAHDWRSDLIRELAKQQHDNGSWVNKADRWYEGDPNLVTAYSLMSLGYCKPDKK